jgi:hypothetical protein
MTITIDVPTELEQRLEQASRQRGIGKAEFLRDLLEEKLGSESVAPPFVFPAQVVATDLPVRDRTREHAWLEQHRDEYAGLYVMLDGDTLIAAGPNAKEVASLARERGIVGALLLYVEGSQQPRSISGGLWR